MDGWMDGWIDGWMKGGREKGMRKRERGMDEVSFTPRIVRLKSFFFVYFLFSMLLLLFSSSSSSSSSSKPLLLFLPLYPYRSQGKINALYCLSFLPFSPSLPPFSTSRPPFLPNLLYRFHPLASRHTHLGRNFSMREA